MDTVRYSDFSLRLHNQAVAQRIPANGTVEVTRRCPMRCVHCYNNLPVDDREARLKELTYGQHCRILDEITDAGCLWLLYTGGEIFARPDFLDIYAYAKQKGLLITLFTNGTLITPEIADYLVEYRPFSIEITIYGASRETHERVTGVAGSYDQCMRGIGLLMERRLPLTLKTMAITLNKHEIWQMKRLAEQDLGLPFRFDGAINCRIDCSQTPLAVRLTAQEVVELDLQDPRRVAEWKRFDEQFHGPVHAADQSDQLYHCGAGLTSFAIDPYGKISLCLLFWLDSYDLLRGNFLKAWEGHFSCIRGRKITRHTKCVACEIKAMCGMCPANGVLESGDPEAPVDFLCRVAHLRAYALGLNVRPHGECEYCKGGVAYDNLIGSLAVPISGTLPESVT